MKKWIHKIKFFQGCGVQEGYKLCTKRLANQHREDFSFWWRNVTCPMCVKLRGKSK